MRPSMPNQAEIQVLRDVGGSLVLRHCVYKTEGDASEPTERNTYPTAWHLPNHDTRRMVSMLLALGYRRDEDRFKGHVNFTHPDGRYVQVWKTQRIVSWYGVPGILGN